MALKDDMQATKNNEFLNLKIGGNSKIIINCYNKKSSIPSSITLLMEDIRKLTQDLDIFNYRHIYREANQTTDYLTKKDICNIEPIIWRSYFPREVTKFGFEDYCDPSFNQICTKFLSIKKN